MLNKILVPTASTNSVVELYAEAETMAAVAAKRATETEAVEVDEGESLDEIKAKLKPKKKGGISADMLDTANTYDDKVALVRIIVTDEAGRVANVFKQLMREDLEVLKQDKKMAEENIDDGLENLSGTEKSAILMMLLGEDEAAQVLQKLTPREVQHLGTAIYKRSIAKCFSHSVKILKIYLNLQFY